MRIGSLEEKMSNGMTSIRIGIGDIGIEGGCNVKDKYQRIKFRIESTGIYKFRI